MDSLANWTWQLDGWIVAAGALSAVAASLLGNFLVLRRMSLLGDAISHAVLPGLAVAFLITGSRSNWPMFVGAVIVGVLTAFFSEWIRGVGKVDEGAAMGVVFTSLFAIGLLLIVQAADHVDLDPGCVLYGSIELTPLDRTQIGSRRIPQAVVILGAVAALNATFVLLFFKELKIVSFDPALGTTSGFSATLMHYALMVLVAVTAVASFESVGSILVVAMFIVPPATAYMLTDRLGVMIFLSVLLAGFSAVIGHIGALVVPRWFGFQSTTTSGMIAVAAGVMLTFAVALAPRRGILVQWGRRRTLSARILAEDVIALLYRFQERGERTRGDFENLRRILLAGSSALRGIIWWLQARGEVARSNGKYYLTSRGYDRATALIRSHRLWEQYLAVEAAVDPRRIHESAEQFEHFTDPGLREDLDGATSSARTDPHGTPIPPEKPDY